jgi:putative ATP-dependent endonuclease of OLD family
MQIADLQRYLDVTRAEVVFAKGVILVEGPGELFLIPAFAEGMGQNLDQLGITVCSVHGTDFLPYWRLLSQEGLNVPHVVVTDGDPEDANGKTRMAGLSRGYRLIDSGCELKEKVKESLSVSRFDLTRKLLAKANVFVGEITLEVDLLGRFSDCIIEAYEELRSSAKAREIFEAAVGEAKRQEADGIERMLGRIDKIGKGRFAQRLADKVKGREPPGYLKAAIDRIVTLVRT